jgi:hypothetical protein
VATQHLLGPVRGRDSLVRIIATLGARRRELRASVAERLRLLDERAAALESHHAQLARRLAGVESRLEQRRGLRREGGNAALHRLGSVLMYVGGLLVLWVALLELGLVLGLS